MLTPPCYLCKVPCLLSNCFVIFSGLLILNNVCYHHVSFLILIYISFLIIYYLSSKYFACKDRIASNKLCVFIYLFIGMPHLRIFFAFSFSIAQFNVLGTLTGYLYVNNKNPFILLHGSTSMTANFHLFARGKSLVFLKYLTSGQL